MNTQSKICVETKIKKYGLITLDFNVSVAACHLNLLHGEGYSLESW
jgi:hypothetical protein